MGVEGGSRSTNVDMNDRVGRKCIKRAQREME